MNQPKEINVPINVVRLAHHTKMSNATDVHLFFFILGDIFWITMHSYQPTVMNCKTHSISCPEYSSQSDTRRDYLVSDVSPLTTSVRWFSVCCLRHQVSA